jgi:hypothetical protein
MYARFLLGILGCVAIAGFASAQVEQRRAAIVGGGDRDRGRCTIEVVVDGAAEVEIRGDTGVLRNLAGQPPQWRRFDCSGPMPANPADFRFEGVDGRGRQELIRDPRNNGAAVVRIEDRDGGREGYKFNLFWSGGGFRGDDRGDRYDRGGDRGGSRRMSTEEAVRVCQESVREQAVERFRTREVEFRRTTLDDNPGRNDWVIGTLMVRRGYGREEVYRFSCSVNFDSGRVRSAEIQQLEGGRYGDREEGRGGGAGATSRALANCQQAVEQRIRRDGYDRVEIGTINIDNRPGRNDWIIGNARAFGRGGRDAYEFSCSVDLRDGDIRSVDVRRR